MCGGGGIGVGGGAARLVGEALGTLCDGSSDDLAGAGGVCAAVDRVGWAGQDPRELAQHHQSVRLRPLAGKHLVGIHLPHRSTLIYALHVALPDALNS